MLQLVRSIRSPIRSVLDAGCGHGETLRFLRSLVPAGTRFVGTDISGATVEHNRTTLPFAEFAVLDLERERLDETFDLVVCSEVIEHLEHQGDAVRLVASMVAPGGHLLLTCPTGKLHATERHFGHVTHPTKSALAALVTRAGLDVINLENWGFPLYVATKYATNVRPDWAIKNFADRPYGRRERGISQLLYLANFGNIANTPFGCQLFLLAHRRR
jgi:SAM-dependent methyltransferase